VSATFGVLVAKAKTGLRYRLQDVDYDGELWITDATNNPGHGGGGLFTLDGRWVGLNARLAQSRETNTDISAAIPVADLVPYIERWTQGKVAAPAVDGAPKAPPFHGIVLFDHGQGRTSPPAYVEKVLPDSPAARAGLRGDDLIVRLDEQTVRTCRQFHEAMARRAAGESVALTYKRGQQVARVDLKLEAAK
jgi:S1-C subfamily serine protease